MNIPAAPHPPAGHPADPVEWAQYLQRYDRYLDLYERHLAQNAEYNRQVAEASRVQSEGNSLYERWVRAQSWSPVVVIGIVLLIVAIGGVVSLFRSE